MPNIDLSISSVFPKRIAVIRSATGSEVEVSLNSARNVSAGLSTQFETVETFRFDDQLQYRLADFRPEVVFPTAHGDGETGKLQRLMEDMGIPYVGSGPESCAVSWDKAKANALVNHLLKDPVLTASTGGEGLSACVPDYVELVSGLPLQKKIATFCRSLDSNNFLVAKPSSEGSSIGVEFFRHPGSNLFSQAEVVSRLEGFDTVKERETSIVEGVLRAQMLGGAAILQRAVRGMEITVAVFEEGEVTRAFPVVEIATPKGTWYDYEQKYKPGASTHTIPARLPSEWLGFAQEIAIAIHHRMGCRDLSRVDFLVERLSDTSDPMKLCFLELNSLPGMTSTSTYPEAAAADGMKLDTLLQRLVMQAFKRQRCY